MELNVLLRGQSNAFYLSQSPDWPDVATQIEQLLGFDGVTNSVRLLASANDPFGKNTLIGGTAFIGDWVAPQGGDWTRGWANDTLETGMLNYINALPADAKSDPTAIVWLHNEYDSTNAGLTTDEWTSAVRFEAAQVRQALGQTAATTPYVFVNAIPYGSGTIPRVNQAIKLGMERLSADLGFHGVIGAQANDVSMDYQQTGIYGGPHLNPADANRVDHRLAASLAKTFAAYALPGSAVANGTVDGFGPQALTAHRVGASQVLVSLALDNAALDGALSRDAADGVGWTLFTAAGALHPTSASVVAPNQVLLGFDTALPSDAGAQLFYAYGYGRLAVDDSDPGVGTAIYDTGDMPLWTPASGLTVWQGAGQGQFAEINWSTGSGGTVAGYAPTVAGYDSQFVALSDDSVAVVALTPNAAMFAGNALDALVATSGNNLLSAGQSSGLLVGGSGDDQFVADASGKPVWEVIQNFNAGDVLTLLGAASAQAPQLSWFDTAAGAALEVSGGGIASALILFQGTTLDTATHYASASGATGGGTYVQIAG